MFSLGINIEENEGVNTRDACDDHHVIKQFWRELYCAWRANPLIEVREFVSVLSWMQATVTGDLRSADKRDIFPTVAWNGDVVLLSPELLSAMEEGAQKFVIGNVVENGINALVSNPLNVGYVAEFSRGVANCAGECEYFSYCRGGQASNKYYETGALDSTETRFCRNSQKRLVDAVLEEVISHQQ